MVEDDDINSESPLETLNIPHKLAKEFTSHFVSGSMVSGPLPDSMFQILFFSEAVSIDHEVADLEEITDEGATYTTREASTSRFREDKVRIVMTYEALVSLREVIDKRLRAVEASIGKESGEDAGE